MMNSIGNLRMLPLLLLLLSGCAVNADLYKQGMIYEPERAAATIEVDVELEATHTMKPGMRAFWRSLMNPESNMVSWEKAIAEVAANDIVSSGLFRRVRLRSAAEQGGSAAPVAPAPIYRSKYFLAQQAERAGRYRTAFNHYLSELHKRPRQRGGYLVKISSWEEIREEDRVEFVMALAVSDPSSGYVIRAYERQSVVTVSPFTYSDEVKGAVRNMLAEIKSDLVADYEAGRLRDPGQDKALRESMIRLAGRLVPRPAISEQAEIHMIQGLLTLANARSEQGLRSAADEFDRALYEAPWYGPGYINLASVQMSLGDFERAQANLEFYLKTSPNPSMRSRAEEMRYTMQRRQREMQAEQQRRAALDKFAKLYGGHAYRSVPCISRWIEHPEIPGAKQGVGCNAGEYDGNYWRRSDVYSFAYYEFYFTQNDEVLLRFVSDGHASSPSLIGRPTGPELSDIEWVCGGSGRKAWVRILEKDGSIVSSCDRPNVSWADPRLDRSKRYGYQWYTRW